MSSLLSIGTSATAAFQSALATTSHNIANVGTEGYSRQRAEIISNTPFNSGHGYQGSGSKVQTIERIYASYIQDQLASSSSLKARYEEQLSLSKNIEGVVAGNDEGIQQFMQRFFDSLQTLADNPTSNTNRSLTVDGAKNMEGLIDNLSYTLQEASTQANKQITNLTKEINNRLDTIHLINKAVETAHNNNSFPPNDLLDQRDQAILELNDYMDIKTFPQEDGEILIYTGDSRLPLVSGESVFNLHAERTEFAHEGRTEVYMDIGPNRTKVSDFISNGQLGAVLDYRKNILDKSINELGVTLNGMTASMNWQHYQGYDINGDAGQDFFKPLNMNAFASNKNIGPEDGTNMVVNFQPNIAALPGFNGQPPYTVPTQPTTFGNKENFLEVANSTIGKFEPKEYEIRVNTAGDFEVFDHTKGGAALATVPFGTAAEIDGLNFDFTAVALGTVSPTDKFLIKPHQQIVKDFETVIQNPDTIATRGQTPVDTNADGSLLDEVPSPAAESDNVNMANMASLQTKSILYADATGAASETLLGGYSKMASGMGLYVRATDIHLTAQNNVFDQMYKRREEMSGVSLDEEAANLLRFQQAYQASAQIIQTSRTLFQTIIGAIN